MATWPGGPMAADGLGGRRGTGRRSRSGRRIQADTLRAAVVDVGVQRGVEAGVVRGVVADDVDDRRSRARRALCRLASPLPSPGPRCSRVAAGRRPSGRSRRRRRWRRPRTGPSTPRIPGTVSRAATKCISLVPGLVKHVVTPASTSVRIMASDRSVHDRPPRDRSAGHRWHPGTACGSASSASATSAARRRRRRCSPQAAEAGLDVTVDSAGTSRYHLGERRTRTRSPRAAAGDRHRAPGPAVHGRGLRPLRPRRGDGRGQPPRPARLAPDDAARAKVVCSSPGGGVDVPDPWGLPPAPTRDVRHPRRASPPSSRVAARDVACR